MPRDESRPIPLGGSMSFGELFMLWLCTKLRIIRMRIFAHPAETRC